MEGRAAGGACAPRHRRGAALRPACRSRAAAGLRSPGTCARPDPHRRRRAPGARGVAVPGQPPRADRARAARTRPGLPGRAGGRGERPFVARPDLSGHDAVDIDARIGDLHYRDVVEWAVGHNVSVTPLVEPDGTVPARPHGVAARRPRSRASSRPGRRTSSSAWRRWPSSPMPPRPAAALGRLPELYEAGSTAQRGDLAESVARRARGGRGAADRGRQSRAKRIAATASRCWTTRTRSRPYAS